ncbi:MAG TPA: C-terminal binding protein [Beijerinckiaceae bacterium]|mgnify:CR=1 FL=1|nr:C-terminal binding protein [Beijerinckiaceae bacterium]
MVHELHPLRVVVVDDGYDSYDTERAVLAAAGATLELRPCRGQAERVVMAIADADAILVRESPVSAAAIAAAPRLRAIVRYGIGVDNVDRNAASERRIYVANVPDYGTEDVSDHALALLMAVARRIVTRDRAVRAGGWFTGSSEKMYRPFGRTLGLVGYGRIARAFERRMRALGVGRVLVHDPFADLPASAEAVTMERLCAESDYVSLHAPLTPATRHILNAARIALLKPTAIIVNTSRGPLIDEVALVEALSAGRIFGAGLDVFECEPPTRNNPLLTMTNVVLADHAGWYSEESVADLQKKAAEEVARILSGKPPRHWINPW